MMPLYAQIETIMTARSATLELASQHSAADIISALRLEGCRAVLVDRAPVFDKPTLLHALYQACGFPAYFGFNWDALSDALVEQADPSQQSGADASGARQHPLILIFQDFALLKTRSPDVAETFLDIVAEVNASTDGGLRQVSLIKR
jgi:RNAse (barnase) inhibitor barstar